MNVENDDTLGAVERVQQKLRDNILDSTRMIGEAQQRVEESRVLTAVAASRPGPDNDANEASWMSIQFEKSTAQ
jgi:hypothetical protein